MNFYERRQAERRADALRDWHRIGRRAIDRERLQNARIAHWLARFDECRNSGRG